MIYLPLLTVTVAAGVLFLLWGKERKTNRLARAEAERLALENKQHRAKLAEIHAVVTRVDCGAERLINEHDELAQSLQLQAIALVRAEPGLAVYLNRNNSFHRALLDVVGK